MKEDNSTSSVLEQDVQAKPAREADITSTKIDAAAVQKARIAAQELIDQLTQEQSSNSIEDGRHNTIHNLRASSLLFEKIETQAPAEPVAITQPESAEKPSNKLKELAGEFVNKQVEKTTEHSTSGLAALLRPNEKKRKGLKAVPEKKQEEKATENANDEYNGWKVIPINTAMGGLLKAAQQQEGKEAKKGRA